MKGAVRIFQPRFVLHGSGVALVSAIDGQIEADEVLGLFAGDTRVLSTYKFQINGNAWTLLSRAHTDHGSAQWSFQNPALRDELGMLCAGDIGLLLRRRVDGALHDDFEIHCYAQRRCRFRLTLQLDADFADLFDVKTRSIPARLASLRAASPGGVALVYERAGFRRGLRVRTSAKAQRVGSRLVFDIALEHGERWSCCVDAEPDLDGRIVGLASDPHRPQPEPPELGERKVLVEADPLLAEAYHCGQRDLRALAIREQGSPPFVAAGVPWFLTPFGRDSLFPALMAGIEGAWLARGALAALAAHQASARDDFRDAEAGKLPHELRRDEHTHRGELPYSPYYGSHDAAALYCLALWNAWRWTGERGLLERHLETALRALRWCDERGDRDGDGLQEYQTRSRRGYRNQSWKDAGDALVHDDGRQAELPLATVELQGYWYAARLAMAELLEALGERGQAAQVRSGARELRARIESRYWMAERGFYAMALDGHKRPVGAISSNPGHLLWCGVPSRERAAAVARRLMEPDLFSGWGLRTLSSRNPAYNPLSYQRGSVWPFDTLIAAAGLCRYAEHEPAFVLLKAVLEAACAFESGRLPELFAGFDRCEDGLPAPYAESNMPQAWSSAVPIAIAQLMLGIVPDAPRRRCVLRPRLPEWLPRLSLRGIAIGGCELAVSLRRDGETTVVEALECEGIEVVDEPAPAPLWGEPYAAA